MKKSKLITIDWNFDPFKSVKELLDKSDKKYATMWAAVCAEGVIHIFDSLFPNDAAPRKAIEAAFAWARGEITIAETKKAASEAYDSAKKAELKSLNASYAAMCAGYAASTSVDKNNAFPCLQFALSIEK